MEQTAAILKVAEEFSATPGPRSPEEGDFSGQRFLELHLRPRFEEARNSGSKLVVDLDGAAGYATSFLEAAFGGLVRDLKIRADEVWEVLELKTEEEPYLREEIETYVREAAVD